MQIKVPHPLYLLGLRHFLTNQLSKMSVRRRYLKYNFLKTISIIFLPVYFHIVDIIGKTQYNEHIILSLTVVRRKNRCIPCIYWVTAIFFVVLKYSNLFLPFTFFLYCSHFTLCYKLIVCPKTAGFMKIIRNLFSFI